jgi:hypothetical protein
MNPYAGILDQPYDIQTDLIEAVIHDCRPRDLAALAEASLFFFLVGVLGRTDAMHPWLCDRCRDVQRDPDDHLDLWARFHYKSTIITFAATLRDLALDPDQTFGIFSHTKQIARGFAKQHQLEMERNPLLHMLWPDIFWKEPRKESPRWSQDEGLLIRRKSNPKETSIESWGLVDGQPTSRHYRTMVYDDVVTLESVATPEQITKTTAAWEYSLALGTDGTRIRYVGTRYHPADTWSVILARGSAAPRTFPATDNGQMDGAAVLISPKTLSQLRRDMGPRAFGAQMLLNPVSTDTATFQRDWFQTCASHPPLDTLNLWILCDPAGGKDKSKRKDGGQDYTVMIPIGLAPDSNYYILPGAIRDRLNLVSRADALFALRRRYPTAQIAYEEYGMQADIAHIRDRQAREHFRFPILAIGGAMPKMRRIERLVPLYAAGRFWFPNRCMFMNSEGEVRDFTAEFFTDEYTPCPVLPHDDMLDCLARILDVPAQFPTPTPPPDRPQPATRTNNTFKPF